VAANLHAQDIRSKPYLNQIANALNSFIEKEWKNEALVPRILKSQPRGISKLTKDK